MFPADILSAGDDLRAKRYSCVELVDECFRYAEHLNEDLRGYVRQFPESAREAAKKADEELASGKDRGPLHGIPIAAKDIIPTLEGPIRAGTEVQNPTWDRAFDAPVVARLREAGVIFTGKTLTMELAVGVPDPDRPGTEARNPWNAARWAGGSSSGGGAGLPARMFLASLGSDTGGSIRVPAAYCGITGLTQTFGRVPKTDVIPLAPSLDVVGPMTHTAADAAAMLQVMAGPDPGDPYSAKVPVPDFSERLGDSIKGLRVGVARRHHLDRDSALPELADRFEDAVNELAGAGAILSEVDLPHYEEAFDAVLLTFFTEGLAHHRRELHEQWEAFAPPTRQAFANALFFNAGDYVLAQKVRRALRRQISDLYNEVDVIIGPTAITGALELDAFSLSEYVSALCTNYWNAIGNPVVSIPMGFTDDGMPLGLQVAGRHFDEVTVLQVADAYQRLTDWHRRVPPMVEAVAERRDTESQEIAR